MKISSVFSLIHCVELKIAWFYLEVASCVMANPLQDYKFLKKKVKVTRELKMYNEQGQIKMQPFHRPSIFSLKSVERG